MLLMKTKGLVVGVPLEVRGVHRVPTLTEKMSAEK
jgi:hypothetical protein